MLARLAQVWFLSQILSRYPGPARVTPAPDGMSSPPVNDTDRRFSIPLFSLEA